MATDTIILDGTTLTVRNCGDVDRANRALAAARSLDPDDTVSKAVEARIARGAPFPSTLRELERGK
jgi:hypothetical protein